MQMSQKNFHINPKGDSLEEDALLFYLFHQMDETDAEHGLNTNEEALRRRIFFGEPDMSTSPVSPLLGEVPDLDELAVLVALLDEE